MARGVENHDLWCSNSEYPSTEDGLPTEHGELALGSSEDEFSELEGEELVEGGRSMRLTWLRKCQVMENLQILGLQGGSGGKLKAAENLAIMACQRERSGFMHRKLARKRRLMLR